MSNYHNYKKALSNGVVVLIDEIDKADSSLPNGLLEVLGSNRFQPDGMDKPVELNNTKTNDTALDSPKPLIIITTNDEHPLPDAFVRRCLVVEVGMPESEQKQKEFLVTHAQPNFKELYKRMISDENDDEKSVLEAVAEQLIDDRKEAEKNNVKPLVGQAEYFDLLRGIDALVKQHGDADIEQWIKSLACFSSQKGQRKASAGRDLPKMGDESNVI
jgi:MoxR-like ATPase